jgi:hypothetical protein
MNLIVLEILTSVTKMLALRSISRPGPTLSSVDRFRTSFILSWNKDKPQVFCLMVVISPYLGLEHPQLC